MSPDALLVLLAAIVLLSVTAFYLYKTWKELSRLRVRFRPVLDVEKERDGIQRDKDRLVKEVKKRRANWDQEIADTIRELEALSEELEDTRDTVEMQSFGFHEPQFDFDTSDEFREAIKANRANQKALVKSGGAAVCNTSWQVEGSSKKGEAMVNRSLKLQLRAFNGECDAAVAKVRYNNVDSIGERLRKAWAAINKLGEKTQCEVTWDYLQLKLAEVNLTYEHKQKLQAEKEEQREIREQMREEERALKEFEKAQREAEKEETRYADALEKARKELAEADERKQEALNLKVAELEKRLEEAHANKERAISRAQLTKSGHVYVISNIGSFGEQIYKIGMTRRLDPMDRVKELGDASVPFPFDVHAMAFSENAPELENLLHKRFHERRLNLVNERKEYFRVDIEEVAEVVREKDAEVHITLAAEAAQFRQTLGIRDARKTEKAAQELDIVEEARGRFEAIRERWGEEPPDEDSGQEEGSEAPSGSSPDTAL